jgi:hypothetical protein
MTSLRRKLEEDMYMEVHPMVTMRRIWHLQLRQEEVEQGFQGLEQDKG